MPLTKTVILKLDVPDNALAELLKTFSQGMNYASQIVFDIGKPVGSGQLQKATYKHLRNNLNLKSQMACNVARQVSGAYKTLQSQIDKKESEWQPIDFDPTSATFSFERDFGLSRDTLSITTLAGRRKYKFINYQYAQRYLDRSWKYLASKLCLHKDGAYFFHLACEKDIPDKNIVDASTFMGVDVGINCLAVASTTDKQCKFFAGGEIKNHRNIRSKERRRLQKAGGRYLGTRSSMRTLRKIAGRETRFMTAVNHKVSKDLIEFAVSNCVSVIGMEDLTGIRKRTENKASKELVLRCFKWLTSRYHEMRSEQGSRNQRAGRLNTQSGWNDWHPGGFMLPVIPTLNSEEPKNSDTSIAVGRSGNYRLSWNTKPKKPG